MRNSSPLLALLALPALSSAVSLSDFTPRASDLPSACDKVYKATISGCRPSDFTSQSGCSTECIDALNNYTTVIRKACAGQTGTNIVTAFLSGNGPSNMCANVPSAPSSSSSVSSASSTQASSSSSTSSTASSSSTDATSTATPTTTVAPLATDTSSMPTPTSSDSTKSGGVNNGGSPMDVGLPTSLASSVERNIGVLFTLSGFCAGMALVFL